MIIQLDEAKRTLKALEPDLKELGEALKIEGLRRRAEELDEQTMMPDFWNDQTNSGKILREVKQLKDKIGEYDGLMKRYEETLELTELAIEEEDESFLEEILSAVPEIEAKEEKMRIEVLLSGEYDANNAILSFHPGAGGTEAQDWAMMLYRMYNRWAEKNGFTVKLIDWLDGDTAGIKSATIMVEGLNAYGFLKSENGVHRLVRVSPFDASGRRQTSFASVEVMPEFNDDGSIEIKDEDYTLWYRDVSEEPQKYDGKTVHFKGQVAMLRRDKNGMFAPGRFVMTCCVEDIQFCGIPCRYAGAGSLESRSWVWVTAKIGAEKHPLYKGDVGPVLTAISVETGAEPADPDVATF